jgi:hypothetical protein
MAGGNFYINWISNVNKLSRRCRTAKNMKLGYLGIFLFYYLPHLLLLIVINKTILTGVPIERKLMRVVHLNGTLVILVLSKIAWRDCGGKCSVWCYWAIKGYLTIYLVLSTTANFEYLSKGRWKEPHEKQSELPTTFVTLLWIHTAVGGMYFCFLGIHFYSYIMVRNLRGSIDGLEDDGLYN